MLEDLISIIKDITDPDIEIQESTLIKTDLHLDSFGFVQLIIALEEKYNITIPERDMYRFVTISDIKNYLKMRLE